MVYFKSYAVKKLKNQAYIEFYLKFITYVKE